MDLIEFTKIQQPNIQIRTQKKMQLNRLAMKIFYFE